SKGNGHIATAREAVCRKFFDVRTFGAVMSEKEYNCGQVLGPMQFCFGRTIDPIHAMNATITRVSVTSSAEEAKREKQETDAGTFGDKWIIPYGLYVVPFFYNPF